MERDIIQLRGIVRNTPASSSEDGQLEEAQNLRFRDGAWRPVGDCLPLKGYDQGESTPYAGKFITHYIHATGDYKHLLGIKQGENKLYYIADLVVPEEDNDEVECRWLDDIVEIAQCSENARMVTNGNICTFVSTEDFFHIMWRWDYGSYAVLGGMLTEGVSATEISPDYAPALRVKGWVVDKDRYPDQWNDERSDAANWKDKRSCKVARVYRFDWGRGAGEGDFSIPDIESIIREKTLGRWQAIKNQEIQEGFLHGFFWACTALKMYDGTYILHSRPVLMQQAADQQIRFGTFSFKNTSGQTQITDDIYINRKDGRIDEYSFLRRPLGSSQGNWDYKIVGEKASNGLEVQMENFLGCKDVIQNSVSFEQFNNQRDQWERFDGTILYTGKPGMVPGANKNFLLYGSADNKNEFKYPVTPYVVMFEDIKGGGWTGDQYWKGHPYLTRYEALGGGKYISYNSDDVKTADSLLPNFMTSYGIGATTRTSLDTKYSRGHEITTTHNVLQIRVDKMVDDSYKNVVQSISVFITPQVYGFDLEHPIKIETENYIPDAIDTTTEEDDNLIAQGIRIRSGQDGNLAFFVECSIEGYNVETYLRHHFVPSRITDEDIREELLKQRTFYKVKEFTWDEYQKDVVGKGWVTIDLEDVLSTLTEQEQLNIDSYTRSEYFSSVCQYYNGKLHIANYKENSFSGWPATYFKAEGYNYIADNFTAAMKIADKARGQGNSADNKINITSYDYIREGGSFLPSAARSFYKRHDGTQTLEIGTAGAAQAAWEREGIDIDEAKFNKFLQERLHEIRLQIDVTTVNEEEEEKTYTRRTPLSYFSDLRLNAMLSFPDIRATKMKLTTYMNTDVILNGRYVKKWYDVFEKTYTLDTDNGFNLAIYLSEDLRHIWAVDWSKIRQLVNQNGGFIDEWTDELPEIPTTNASEYPNQLKVSEVNNPLYYPPENTYVVSNGSIMAMENDSISMQAGQYGTSPLYVFSSDGIYGLMVDASGELTYTNSRCIARDVLSDAGAIESTEAGVIFPTRHGLMSISNQLVTELSEPVEGTVVPWFDPDPSNYERLPQAILAETSGKFGKLDHSEDEFKKFVQGAVIGYNYIDKEIWVSKAGQGTFVLTRNGWTRVSVEARKYVADYPHYYMQNEDNKLYWLGREVETATGEDGQEKAATTPVFFITRPLKMGAEDFKQALRLVLRCRLLCEDGQLSSLVCWGSYDCRKWTCLGGIDRVGSIKDIGKVVNRTDCKYFKFAFFGKLQPGSFIDYAEVNYDRRLYANGKIR